MNNPFELVDRYREELLREFGAAVPDMQRSLEQLHTEALHVPAGPEGWSLHQELAYLRDVEKQLFWPGLQRLLAEPASHAARVPQLESAFPIRRADWAAGYSPEEPLEGILAEWSALRRQELERVQDLPRAAWNRTVRHPQWGVRTLQWWVEQSLACSRKLLKRLEARYNLSR